MQRYNNISDNFIRFDLKSFIDQYLGQDIPKLTLRLSKQYDFDFALLAEQLRIYPKAQIKLPSFTKQYCFFTVKSYEQASSEILADYKASLFSGNICLDLSGGLGIDDWAFSKQFRKVVSLDKDQELNKLVRKNFEKLGIDNIDRLDADAYEYIKTSTPVDLIYLDADRRPESINKRVAGLSDAEPDVLAMKERLFTCGETILLKLSPMLDISAVISELKDVKELYVISLHNEVKELLVVMKKGSFAPVIHAIDMDDNEVRKYSATWHQPLSVHYNDQGTYFYEPALSLIKSGISPEYAHEQQLDMLAPNTYYFTGNKKVADFFGRSFKIAAKMEFSKSVIKKYLKENAITKANIAKRNFMMDVEELKKLFLIKDGGEDYLFFTQNNNGQKLMFHCRKEE